MAACIQIFDSKSTTELTRLVKFQRWSLLTKCEGLAKTTHSTGFHVGLVQKALCAGISAHWLLLSHVFRVKYEQIDYLTTKIKNIKNEYVTVTFLVSVTLEMLSSKQKHNHQRTFLQLKNCSASPYKKCT